VKKGYFETLATCIGISAMMLAGGHIDPSADKWVQGLLMGLALAPLIFYHVVFLWLGEGRKTGSGAVDSVYYYGFLLTVGALALSAIDVALGRAESDAVIFNFGLGLAATGYAVLARMHLLSLGDVEEAEANYLKSFAEKSGTLFNDLDLAAIRVRDFSDSIQRDIALAHNRGLAAAEDRLVQTAGTFEAAMKEAIASTASGLQEVQCLAREVAMEVERSELKSAVADAARATKKLGLSIAELTESTTGSVDAAQRHQEGLRLLGESTTQLRDVLNGLAGPNGSLVVASASVSQASGVTQQAILATSRSLEAATSLTTELGELTTSIGKLKQFASETAERFEHVAGAARQIDDGLAELSRLEAVGGGLAKELRAAAEALSPLSDKSRVLAGSLDSLRLSLAESTGAIERDVAKSTQAGSMLVDSLSRVAATIVESTKERQRAN
jgi:hypothetical protein